MVIVDTTVWIDYLNGIGSAQTDWLEQELDRQRLGLTDLILCEVLQGVSNERQAARTRRALSEFELYETGGVDLAVEAAANYRKLRARGHTVRKTIDTLIATFCLRNEFALLHNDSDYDPFELFLSLKVVRP